MSIDADEDMGNILIADGSANWRGPCGNQDGGFSNGWKQIYLKIHLLCYQDINGAINSKQKWCTHDWTQIAVSISREWGILFHDFQFISHKVTRDISSSQEWMENQDGLIIKLKALKELWEAAQVQKKKDLVPPCPFPSLAIPKARVTTCIASPFGVTKESTYLFQDEKPKAAKLSRPTWSQD